jgi:hypothetical protein
MSYDVLLHDRCGRKLSEHPLPHAPSVQCPFPALPPREFRVALPTELVGTSWDTPEGRAHYARVTVDRSSNPQAAVQLYAVARTLRWCADMVVDEPDHDSWSVHWRETADRLDTMSLDEDGRPDDGGCCVVCQEVVCDDGCPLEELRTGPDDRT